MVPEVVWLWERYLKLKASLAQEYDVRGYTILFPLKKKKLPSSDFTNHQSFTRTGGPTTPGGRGGGR